MSLSYVFRMKKLLFLHFVRIWRQMLTMCHFTFLHFSCQTRVRLWASEKRRVWHTFRFCYSTLPKRVFLQTKKGVPAGQEGCSWQARRVFLVGKKGVLASLSGISEPRRTVNNLNNRAIRKSLENRVFASHLPFGWFRREDLGFSEITVRTRQQEILTHCHMQKCKKGCDQPSF